jgi:site-specific recombinase XerD
MQFRAFADEFLHYCAAERQLSQNTLQAYALDLADFCKWLPRDVVVAEISNNILRLYLAEMISHRKLAVSTVRRRFACLRALFQRSAGLAEVTNPFTGWRIQLPRRRRLPRALSRMEISSLLVSLASDEASRQENYDDVLRNAVRLMVSTGVRVGELCKLRIEDICPDMSSFRIHGKGSRDRIAYITDCTLRQDLGHLVQDRRQRCGHGGLLFVNLRGLPIRPQTIRSRLHRHAKGIGIARRVTPHMLRHTAATLLIETGVDIRFVQRLLGHASIATTEIYTHVSDEALRLTLERADVLGTLGQR